jgi:hypothetical protein
MADMAMEVGEVLEVSECMVAAGEMVALEVEAAKAAVEVPAVRVRMAAMAVMVETAGPRIARKLHTILYPKIPNRDRGVLGEMVTQARKTMAQREGRASVTNGIITTAVNTIPNLEILISKGIDGLLCITLLQISLI